MNVLRDQLELDLPPVTLLLGPYRSGKKTYAQHLIYTHTDGPVDRLWVPLLTMEAAEEVQHFAYVAPVGKLRVAGVVLVRASSGALNRMLKLLEEPPETVRFILVSEGSALGTIRSRAQVVTFGTTAEGLSAEELKAKTAALTAIKAALSADSSLLRTALRVWGAEDSHMLARWAEEKLSGRWGAYSPADTSADRGFAQRLLAGLAANRAARPKLAARTALEAAARGK